MHCKIVSLGQLVKSLVWTAEQRVAGCHLWTGDVLTLCSGPLVFCFAWWCVLLVVSQRPLIMFCGVVDRIVGC